MSRLLPIRSDPDHEGREPTMLALDDERADEVFDALGSKTARTILQTLHSDPQPASELTDVVDTSLQNVQYHLTKLQAADLVTVVDTWYGQNGAEMDVYAPTDQALVLFAGDDPESSLRQLLEQIVGAVVTLAVGALAIVLLVDRYGREGGSTAPINASTDYNVATEPAVGDPLVLAVAFVGGGLLVLGVLVAVELLHRR